MTLVVATLGSAGDLHPFLAVARAARERGDDVRLLSVESHRTEVEAQGVRFEAILGETAYRRCAQHPLLWHPVQGFGVLWRHAVAPAIEPTVRYLTQLCRESIEPVRVLASPLVLGARLAADILPLHLTTAHTAPSALRTLTHPMFVGGQLIPHWWPVALRRTVWSLVDRLKLDPMARPGIDAWRASHDQPALTEPVFARWIHSAHRVLGLFDRHFAAPAPDWPLAPGALKLVGFPRYLSSEAPTADPELADWLDACGQALVVCYLGSTTTAASSALQAQAKRLSQQGYRVLMLGPRPVIRPEHSLWRETVHLPGVLSRARLALHHGGIGFAAQCLATETPQVIEPCAFDQPENAWRIARMQGLASGGPLATRVAAALSLPLPARGPIDWSRYARPGQPNEAVTRILTLLDADAQGYIRILE
jgi:rhamnosyltransferase subunit B